MVNEFEVALIFEISSMNDEIDVLTPIKVVVGTYKGDVFISSSDNMTYEHIETVKDSNCGFGMRTLYVATDEKNVEDDLEQYLNYYRQFIYYRAKDNPSMIFMSLHANETRVIYNDIDSKLETASKKPIDIENEIKETIKGHDEGIKEIVSSIWTNIKFPDMAKRNVLIVGADSVGKKSIFKKLKEVMDVPLIIYPVSAFVDGDAGDLISQIFVNGTGDNEQIDKAIIVLDELDKLITLEDDKINNDFLQAELIRLVNGIKGHLAMDDSSSIELDTANIIFVGMGAFDDKRFNAGFSGEDKSNNKINDRLVKYGMKRELVNMFPVVIELGDLSEETIKDILLNSNESELKKVQEALKLMGVRIQNLDKVADIIACDVVKRNLGARGILPVVNKVFANIFYTIGNNPMQSGKLIVGDNILNDPNDFILDDKKTKVKIRLKKAKE